MDTVPHELYKEQGSAVPGADFQEAAAKDSLAEFTEAAKFRKPTAFDLKIVALDYVVLATTSTPTNGSLTLSSRTREIPMLGICSVVRNTARAGLTKPPNPSRNS